MKQRTWKTITISVFSYILAALFFLTGGAKLAAAEPMVANFEAFGLPLWFLFITGAVEVAAAALLLFRRTRFYGAAALVATMIGGVLVHVLGNDAAGSGPAAILGMLTAIVAWVNRPDWLPLVGARPALARVPSRTRR